jgi:hypothetical protein
MELQLAMRRISEYWDTMPTTRYLDHRKVGISCSDAQRDGEGEGREEDVDVFAGFVISKEFGVTINREGNYLTRLKQTPSMGLSDLSILR